MFVADSGTARRFREAVAAASSGSARGAFAGPFRCRPLGSSKSEPDGCPSHTVAPPADDTHGWSRQPVVKATSRAELVVGGMGERVLVAVSRDPSGDR
jgi:hypothetical protein